MAMPTKDSTWQYLLNQTPASTSNKHLLIKLVELFLAFPTNPWTVVQCCSYYGPPGPTPPFDYLQFTVANGVNNWTNENALQWSNRYYGSTPEYTRHSWIILQNPGFGYQILIDLDISLVTYYEQMQLYYSRSVGFSGGTPYVRPTASDEVMVLSRSSYAGWTPQATGTNKLHALHTTDGKQTRIFIHRAGAKISSWMFDYLVDTPASTTWPVVIWGAPGAYPALTWGTMRNISKFYCRAYGADLTCNPATETCYYTGASQEVPVAQQFSGAVNSFTGNYGMTPLWVYSVTDGARGKLGRIPDMYVGSSAIAEGDTYPVAQPDWVQFGHLIHPWDGVTTPQTT